MGLKGLRHQLLPLILPHSDPHTQSLRPPHPPPSLCSWWRTSLSSTQGLDRETSEELINEAIDYWGRGAECWVLPGVPAGIHTASPLRHSPVTLRSGELCCTRMSPLTCWRKLKVPEK